MTRMKKWSWVFLAILAYMRRRRQRLAAFDAEEEMTSDETSSP